MVLSGTAYPPAMDLLQLQQLSGCKIIFININSAANKIDILNDLFNKNFDVIALADTRALINPICPK